MKRILILLGLIFLTICASGQGPFGTTVFLTWAPGENIGLRFPPNTQILMAPFTSPVSSNVIVSSGAIVNFGVVFSDIDEARCLAINPNVSLQFPHPRYRILLTSSHPDALFGNETSTTLPFNQTLYQNNPLTNNDKYAIILSETGQLNISQSWNQTPIDVTLTITDKSSDFLTLEDFGNPEDLVFTKTFTLSYGSNCPTTLSKFSTPPEGVWVNNQIIGIYEGAPQAAPAYQDYIITELVEAPMAANMFGLDDLNPSWLSLSENSDVIDEQTAIDKIFPIMEHSQSFTLNQLNQFEDTHEGLINNDSNLFTYLSTFFKQSALQNGKAGYLVKQTYFCGQANIGEAEVCRRYKYSSNPNDNFVELKKTHTF